MSEGNFSDVSLVYSENCGNLDKARRVFQNEVSELNETICKACDEIISETSPKMLRWRDPEVMGKERDGSWLNYERMVRITMDFKPVNSTNYKRVLGYLYFEIRYVEDTGAFRFRARFENRSDKISTELDEEMVKIAREKNSEILANPREIKRNTAIIFSHEISNKLYEDPHIYIKTALEVCSEAVGRFCPQAAIEQAS